MCRVGLFRLDHFFQFGLFVWLVQYRSLVPCPSVYVLLLVSPSDALPRAAQRGCILEGLWEEPSLWPIAAFTFLLAGQKNMGRGDDGAGYSSPRGHAKTLVRGGKPRMVEHNPNTPMNSCSDCSTWKSKSTTSPNWAPPPLPGGSRAAGLRRVERGSPRNGWRRQPREVLGMQASEVLGVHAG